MGEPVGGEAQGFREGVLEGVELARSYGQRSRSAVFLVHAESLGQAPGGSTGDHRRRASINEDRRLSHRECERLVTAATDEDVSGKLQNPEEIYLLVSKGTIS